MDIHVPTLDRMYHKRLKGYSELGYQVRFGERDEASTICHGHEVMPRFEEDLVQAGKSIVIVSPYIQYGRVIKLLPILQKALFSGIEVTVHVQIANSLEKGRQDETRQAIYMLEHTGLTVTLHEGLQQRFAVLDGHTVWYGNVDLLAFGRKDSEALRFKNADVAGELLGSLSESDCEQLMLKESGTHAP